MQLKNLNNSELTARMEKLARTERKITRSVLECIGEIEIRKLYAELGFESMYSYLTKSLGYSEGSAYRRIQSARLLRSVPEIKEKLNDGRINLTQLTEVQKCIAQSKKQGAPVTKTKIEALIERIEDRNTFETLKVVAQEFDLPLKIQEHLTPQKDESVRIEITLTKEQFAELEMARNLLSHTCPDGKWADVIATLARKHNSRLNKISTQSALAGRKREVNRSSSEAEIQPNSNIKNTNKNRKQIPITVKRELLERADWKCQYQDPARGIKCASRFQLEIDHISPLARGGSNETENLRILCRTHNLQSARALGLVP